jgi:radical SAM protein with 4Fe4S-binding SPASM domain
MPDLSWVDEFITRVKPYIFVRLEDNLLIKRPNMAQKINPSGARILKALLDGMPIKSLLERLPATPEKTRDIALFIHAVRQQLEGTLDEFTLNPAVEVSPFDMKFSTLPVLSEIALTYRCNCTCAFCYAGCGCTADPTGDEAEMTYAEITRILEILFNDARVPSVSFTGGEPTLVPFLPELVRYAKDLGMRVNLITNGTRISREFACELAGHGLDSAQVSLEGVAAAVHDSLVRLPGAFDLATAAVRHLSDAGIVTHTNTTITRHNLEECVEMPRFVRDKLGRDRFSMNLVIPAGSGAEHEELCVPYSTIGQYLEEIMAASKDAGVEFMWYSPVPMCMFNSVAHGLGNKGCSACDGLISIAPSGDVLPCSSCADPVGNLLKEPFEQVWQSQRAVKYREKSYAHPECRACEDFYMCHGACPLYWDKKGFKELCSARGFKFPVN